MPIVGVVGLGGNLLSVVVLSAKEMSNSFNKLLITLTVFDSTLIVFMVFDYAVIRGIYGSVSPGRHLSPGKVQQP